MYCTKGNLRSSIFDLRSEQIAHRGSHITFRGQGFTLLEVMVVLILIGLLATIVTVNVRSYLVAGKQNAAKAEISSFTQALETFYATESRYPTNEEGLVILTKATAHFSEPLLPKVPKDPWGNPYQYNAPGKEGHHYEIISFGADGREGGTEGTADADIVSWALSDR